MKSDCLLEDEIAFYERERENLLLQHPNRVLLIFGNSLEGDFETFDAAVAAGYRRFGQTPFLVRRSGEDTPTATAPALSLGLIDARTLV